MNPTLEEYVAYGLDALKQRRAALVNDANTATNPLDRLSLIDKINELDTCAKYFADYKNFVNAPAQSEPPKAKQSKENN